MRIKKNKKKRYITELHLKCVPCLIELPPQNYKRFSKKDLRLFRSLCHMHLEKYK